MFERCERALYVSTPCEFLFVLDISLAEVKKMFESFVPVLLYDCLTLLCVSKISEVKQER